MKDVFRVIKEANKLGNTDDVARLINYIEEKYYEKEYIEAPSTLPPPCSIGLDRLPFVKGL